MESMAGAGRKEIVSGSWHVTEAGSPYRLLKGK